MEIKKKHLKYLFLIVAGCILFYWLINEPDKVYSTWDLIWAILSPFVLGASIAFVLNVPMRSIEKLLHDIENPGIHRGIAITITIIAAVLVITVILLLLSPQLVTTVYDLIPEVERWFSDAEKWVNQQIAENPDLFGFLHSDGQVSFDLLSILQSLVPVIGGSVLSIIQTAFSAVTELASTLMNLVISVVFAVYALFQKELLARQGRKVLYAFLSEKHADEAVRVLRLSNAVFSNFLAGHCIEVTILGSMFAVSMAIFQMPYIPLISVLIAVTAFIPVVGAWIGCIVGAFLILVTNGFGQALWFSIMFLILQEIENNMIYPKVVGTSIGLSGMWVLVAIGVGGEIMGVGGMLVMIPLVSVLYTLAREFTAKRLAERGIPEEKLQGQPFEVTQHINKDKERKQRIKLQKMKEKFQKLQEQQKKKES